MSLLDSSEGEEEVNLGSGDFDLKVNDKYAKKFVYQKEREELMRLKQKYGNDATLSASDSDSESEDEDAELLTAEMDRDIFRTISLIKAKDPKIYEKGTKLFKKPTTKSDKNDADDSELEKEKKEKPMTLRDYERRELTEKGAEAAFGGDESEVDEDTVKPETTTKSYVEEMASLKDAFKMAHDSDAEEAVSEEDGDIFDVKVKTAEEEEDENADYLKWLAGQVKEVKMDNKQVSETETLRRYYTDPNLDKNEKFLRDYVLGRMWNDNTQNAYAELATDDSGRLTRRNDIDLSEDEEAVDKAEDFERKINFRFEEEGGFDILNHPRQIKGSVRQRDNKRKDAREAKKERDKKKKEEKKAELQRLKNLKGVEILERLRKLREITGNDELEVDIEADYDPEQYEKEMANTFDDAYYAAEDLEKPTFSDDGLDIENWSEDSDDEVEVDMPMQVVEQAPATEEPTAEDAATSNGKKKKKKKKKKAMEEWETNAYEEEDDFIMDADYVPEESETAEAKTPGMAIHPSRMASASKAAGDIPPVATSKKATKKRMARLLKHMGDKPAFDPEKLPFEKYLEEYYKLDFEDIIGDQPVRFKYREVLPNDYGLTTDEILAADDKELNSWVSLRRIQKYQPESHMKKEAKAYKKKPEWMKKKMLKSVYGEMPASKKEKEKETEKEGARKRKHQGSSKFNRNQFNENMVGEDRLASYGAKQTKPKRDKKHKK